MREPIRFKCPSCGAEHTRGFVDGVCTFRCFGCGYQGHGFHPVAAIDKAVYADHLAGNALNRRAGVPEVPLGIDPQDFAS